jgi:hypothetical protein
VCWGRGLAAAVEVAARARGGVGERRRQAQGERRGGDRKEELLVYCLV